MSDRNIGKRDFLGLAGCGAVGLVLWNSAVPARSAGTFEVTKTDAQWRRQLGPQRFAVLRRAATERPGSSALLKEHRRGAYTCAGCGLPLFTSAMKFNSGTGWPSFFTTIPGAFASKTDYKIIYPRTEYHCARCGGHHGHVFDDGPPPTRQRYCNNGVALKFIPKSGKA